MLEIYPQLFIGAAADYETTVCHQPGWAIVHACKEPYHRDALGYTSQAAPKTHPEYLIARRGHRLILNLVDAPNPAYIPKEIIDAALAFIHTNRETGSRVLVHCNQGASRAPIIGLLYLAHHTNAINATTFTAAEQEFRQRYPPYAPGPGMRDFASQHWGVYRSLGSTDK